jgi:hypothetical protein
MKNVVRLALKWISGDGWEVRDGPASGKLPTGIPEALYYALLIAAMTAASHLVDSMPQFFIVEIILFVAWRSIYYAAIHIYRRIFKQE